MGIGKRLKEARISKGLTQEQLASAIRVTKGAIANYENETSHPKESVMYSLINALDVDANFLFQDCVNTKSAPSLSDEAQKIAKQYDALDAHGKRIVKAVIAEETNRMDLANARPASDGPDTKIIPLFGNSFAAGPAEPDFGNLFEDYTVPSDSPAEFAIHITGDSMEPYLRDGSIVMGRKKTPSDGDVAAILLDGTFLCKQVCMDVLGNLYLFSLNRKRADADVMIMHDSDRSVKCFGTIIMEKRVPLPES